MAAHTGESAPGAPSVRGFSAQFPRLSRYVTLWSVSLGRLLMYDGIVTVAPSSPFKLTTEDASCWMCARRNTVSLRMKTDVIIPERFMWGGVNEKMLKLACSLGIFEIHLLAHAPENAESLTVYNTRCVTTRNGPLVHLSSKWMLCQVPEGADPWTESMLAQSPGAEATASPWRGCRRQW